MRVLVNALTPSHLTPMIPLTWALRAAGHDVAFLGQADSARTAQQAGLSTRRLGPAESGAAQWNRPAAPNRSPFTVRGSGRSAPWLRDEPPWELMGQRWAARLRTFMDEYLQFARAWQPDLIITDPLEFAGLSAGAVLGVPVVVHRWGIDNFSSALLAPARRALHDVCAEWGAPDGLAQPALTLDPCPPSVQSPNVPVAQPIRFVPYNGTAEIPDWAIERPRGTRICLLFGAWGSMQLAAGGGLRAIVANLDRALDGLADVEAVLLLPREHQDALGTLPSRIRPVGPVPVNQVLRDCDLVVHHGGNGTALTALAYGVPQLVLAQDGPLLVPNAELIDASGAGRAIIDEADRADPELLRRVLVETLAEPKHRRIAAEIRQEIAAMPALPEVVGRLAAVAGMSN
jgi:UDP:flavonoid glycosyltransferase YjiC (YdhE family)